LSIDLGAAVVLSLSGGDSACGGAVSVSIGMSDWRSDWRIEERCVNVVGDGVTECCGEVRNREWERRCDCTRIGYGDSWSKTIELIDEP